MRKPSPCPYCGDQPDIGRCEPWPKDAGPQPWYVSCYKSGEHEHHVGENGYTREEAIENWELEVPRHRVRAA